MRFLGRSTLHGVSRALILLLWAFSRNLGAAGPPPVRVILWFDTEDYLLPADDDATLRLARLLSDRGIRATFKLVGEKARVLEARKRTDVIAALGKHDIGYHSDFHSVHPTPAEYLSECGWLDGVDEFVRREADGAASVRRIFGVPTLSCYGQPGSSWAPQTFAALPRLGIAPGGVPCYVDSGSHVGLGGVPFWFAGTLTIYRYNPNETRMDLHDPGAEEAGKEAFQAIHARLAARGGGLISIYYHPCEWVHRQFWDGVNFARGANPPREEWKVPPQRTAEETEAAFARFERYLDFQRAQPGVEFVTASDLPGLYPDLLRAGGAGLAEVAEVVEALRGGTGVGYLTTKSGLSFSAADQLALLLELLKLVHEKGELPGRCVVPRLLGPGLEPPETEVQTLEGATFRDVLLAARQEAFRSGQVPARIFAGTQKIAPLDFVGALAGAAGEVLEEARKGAKGLKLPAHVQVPRGTTLRAAEHVAEDTPGIFGGWVIHREGFRAPRLLALARLQAWTLKPATPRAEPSGKGQ